MRSRAWIKEKVRRDMEMRRDALRYRWLRERGAWDTEMFLNGLTPEQYDDEVDRRMAEQERAGDTQT